MHVGGFRLPSGAVSFQPVCVWPLCELIRSEGIMVIGRLVNH